ncbi:MAG: MurR/RpiR family transcriptional regulator [Ruminococcaceae bacterium]|nr:MurR/RpiR family transcriptional regulator [Oscillospiraceae bacterium]
MNKKNDIIVKLKTLRPTFSKSQKLIADFIYEHYDQAAFMTAAKLGEKVGVSESTIVRFATELGYSGYPAFQHVLREIIKNKLTASQRMEITSSKFADKDILSTVLSSDIDKLRQTLETVSVEDFSACIDTIMNAHKVYVIGSRTCFSIANFLGFYLNLISIDSRLITTNSASETFEQIFTIGPDDVIIAISYPRYSRRTLNAVKYAHNRGSKVIAITDSEISPIVEYSNHKLLARSDMSNFVDSLVAPLSIINALIVALVMRNRDKVSDNFDALENIWEEYNVYEKHIEE